MTLSALSVDEIPRGSGRWEISNGLLRVCIDAENGADITSIVYLPTGDEVLWINPVGSSSPKTHDESATAFYDSYPGGAQDLFPNAGPECNVDGAPLPFHGESCRTAWKVMRSNTSPRAEITLTADLKRMPFLLAKRIWLEADEKIVHISSQATNMSGRRLPFHWGFHPAFSEAVTKAPAQLIGDFGDVVSDPGRFGFQQTYVPGVPVPVGTAQDHVVIDLVPDDAHTADLAYADCHEGWFVLRSEATGLAAAVTWPSELLPALWIWQECHDPTGYPWWGRYHIVGIEPHTSGPSRSLAAEVADGAARWAEPGEMLRAEFAVHVAQIGQPALDQFVENVAWYSRSTSASLVERKKE